MDKSDPVSLSYAAPKLLAKRRPEPLPIEALECLANPEEGIVVSNESFENLEASADGTDGTDATDGTAATDDAEIDDEIAYD
jgi:hypothetical protein